MWISRKRWNEVCFELDAQKKEIAKISRLLGITDYNGQDSDKKGIWYPGKKQNDLYFKAYAQHGAVISISKCLGIMQNTGDESNKEDKENLVVAIKLIKRGLKILNRSIP